MKKLLYIIIGVAGLLLTACDEVKESERFIYVKPADVARAVLIEDFTGQRCINCPLAHETIEQLQELYGADKVVAVSIHGGQLALYTNSRVLGLRTALGDEYNTYYGTEAWPIGLVNRQGGLLMHDKWGASTYSELGRTSSVDLQLAVDYQADSRSVSMKVTALSSETLSAKLQLWVVEDGIVAPQMMPDGSMDADYVHNNVFRDAVNGAWGTDFPMTEAVAVEAEFSYTLPGDWNADHVGIVAFVYNDTGVLQVVRTQAIPLQPIDEGGLTE